MQRGRERETLIFLNAEEKSTKVGKKKKKNTHSLHLDSKKKTLFLVGLLINWSWQQTWCVHRSSFQVRYLFSLPLPLSSSSWFAAGVLGFSFFFFLLNFCLVVLVLFTLYSFLFVLLNFDFFRFLQNTMEWSEWTHLIFYFFIFKKSDLVDGS